MRISDWSSDVCSSDQIVEDRRGRQIALLDRVGIEEGLERRSRLAIAVGGVDRRRGGGGARAADISEHVAGRVVDDDHRSEEHTSELQSLMRNSYAVFCLKKNNKSKPKKNTYDI